MKFLILKCFEKLCLNFFEIFLILNFLILKFFEKLCLNFLKFFNTKFFEKYKNEIF